MAPSEILERANAVRDSVSGRLRISVTDLARSKDWRTQLPRVGVMEVTDRGDTAGWLLSNEDMTALIEGYAYLEEELERASIAALFATRDDVEPLTGEALQTEALAAFEERKDHLKAVVDGD